MLRGETLSGRADHRQEKCAPMSAGSAGFAPKRRINRWLRREQRDHRSAGIASRQEPGLSFTQVVRMGRAYGKCRINQK